MPDRSFDVLIAGGGPAGLSAATILGRCRRTVVISDAGLPRNRASRAVRGVLGHEGLAPAELLAKGRQELLRTTQAIFQEKHFCSANAFGISQTRSLSLDIVISTGERH